MKQLRRVLLILLAAMTVSLMLLPLGRTPSADRIRANAQRRTERSQLVEPRKPAASDNRAPLRPTRDHVAGRLMFSLLQMGGPGCLTLLILATVQRRRRQPA